MTELAEHRTVVHVDGELIAEGPSELQRTCAGIGGPLILDLAGLGRVDQNGIGLLHALAAGGADLLNMNPYIGMLLRESGERAWPDSWKTRHDPSWEGAAGGEGREDGGPGV